MKNLSIALKQLRDKKIENNLPKSGISGYNIDEYIC